MGLILNYKDGQTPLDPDQIDGLKIKTIATQKQLNEFEQANINEALSIANKNKGNPEFDAIRGYCMYLNASRESPVNEQGQTDGINLILDSYGKTVFIQY